MKVFDESIKNTLSLLSSYQKKALSSSRDYPLKKEKVFIFSDEALVSLGARGYESSYLTAYTSNGDLVKSDEIYLIGKDILELKGNCSFAHIVLLRLEDDDKKEQELYQMLRNIEYERYKMNPVGYMIRVNTNELREGALISKEAFENNLSFADIGSLFLKAYKKRPEVKAVNQYFITDPNFDYKSLRALSKSNEGIVVALDHIMKKLAMDCNTCSFKSICDEVEGMREIHKNKF